jgi:hypothetical protein
MEISPLRLCPGSDVNPGSGPRLRAARRSDLIFGAGVSTDNTRFVHVEHNVYVPGVPGHPVRFGSDDDVSKATARLFVQYSGSYGSSASSIGRRASCATRTVRRGPRAKFLAPSAKRRGATCPALRIQIHSRTG